MERGQELLTGLFAWGATTISADGDGFGTRIGLTHAKPTCRLTHVSVSLSLAPVYAGASVLDLQTPQ